MPKVVIVGAGACGLVVLRRLRDVLSSRRRVELIVVEPTTHRVFTPLLPRVAAGKLHAHTVARPLRGEFEKARHVLDAAERLDTDRRELVTRSGTRIPYDVLALTAGSRPIDSPSCERPPFFAMRTLEDALALRQGLQSLERPARVVVVGGGCVGVSTAGALAAAGHHVTLVERGPRLLTDMQGSTAREAARLLTALGAKLVLRSRALEGADGVLHLGSGRAISCDLVVWCAGLAAQPVLGSMEAYVDSAGRIAVDARLQMPDTSDVFVGGDAVRTEGGPQRRGWERALAHGEVIATNIQAALAGLTPKAAVSHHGQELVGIGPHAVANVRGAVLPRAAARLARRAWLAHRVPAWTRLAMIVQSGRDLVSSVGSGGDA